MRRSWPVLATPDADPVVAIFFEMVGLGAASIEPFDTLATTTLEAWVDWLTVRIDSPDPESARVIAQATLATLDGLLLMRHTLGHEAAHAAAIHHGIAN